jgi:hypothetical protein
MGLRTSILNHLYEHSEALYKQLGEGSDTRIILHYVGDLSAGFASAISNRLERLLDSELESKQVQRRFFSVFIEAVQNIRIHGCRDEDDHIHAGLIVYATDDQISVKMLNVVSQAQGRLLERRYDEVNSADPSNLKSRYLDLMQHGDVSDKGGAGLGIITIVLRSKNPSPYRMIPINKEYVIFESTISVNLS